MEEFMSEIHQDIVYVTADENNLPVFQAMASKTRLQIISILKNKELSIKDLSQILDLSSGITTRHIQMLEQAGIIESYTQPGKRGLLKLCRLKINEMQVIFNNDYETEKNDFTEIKVPIGSYSNFDIMPPCGLSGEKSLIGKIDDPRYFSVIERKDINHLWFTSGFLEYPIPIYDINTDRIQEILISLELSSEYPGYNNSFQSDINFYFNNIFLCSWTSPGDFGGRKGRFTPSWWNLGSEYGLLKTIKIKESGVYLDGIQVSKKGLSSFLENRNDFYTFKIECPKNSKHPGGVNLYGEGFGDYNQNILIKFSYQW